MINNDNKHTINEMCNLISHYIDLLNAHVKESLPKVELIKIDVELPKSDSLTDYVGRNKTYQATLKVNYKTTHKKSTPEVLKIKLPILIQGIYIIEGKCKLPLNYVINDQKCKVGPNKIILSSDDSLIIDMDKHNPGLKIATKGENKKVTHELVDWDTIDPEILKLPEYEAKKLAILFDIEGELPTKLTPELIDHLVANFKPNLRDNALNKVILTPSMALLRNLRINTNEVMRPIRGKYYRSFNYKSTKYGSLYLKSLQLAINQFFLGTDMYFNGIQNPSISNPLIFESMKSKIIFENKKSKISKYVPYSKLDLSFYGIIDPTQTPDNGNTSRMNELSRCVDIHGGKTYIMCYDKDFNEIELEYIDYINARILKSEHVDYDHHKVIPSDVYNLKYRFKEIQSDSYDYIELHPDYRLSLTGSQIPMTNLCDSVRVAMGGKMINQAIGVTGGELPMVSSGNDSVDTSLITRSDMDGVVVSSEEGVIQIKNDEGNVSTFKVPKPIKGQNGTNILFLPIVNEGTHVKVGDSLIKPDTVSVDNRLKIGVNARVAMMTYRGYNFEDGVIVSESLAEKFTSVSIEDITIEITPDIIVEGYADVGKSMKSPDKLISGKKMRKFKGKNKDLRKDLGLNIKYATPWDHRLPNDMPEVIVYDLRIAKGTVDSDSEETDFLMNEGRGKQFDRNSMNLDDLSYDHELIPDFEATEGSAYTIKYRLIVKNKLKTQDKVSNRYGSKGVVSLILPDDQMPYDEDGNRIECIMNPDAPMSRKNLPQTIELELTAFMRALMKKHKDSPLSVIREDYKKYLMANYESMTDSEVMNYINTHDTYQYITGSFSRVTPKLLADWMDEMGCSAKVTLYDGITNRRIRNKILVSNMYMIKLYFMANIYAKVTASKVEGARELAMGLGSITNRGSKHGNMEMDAIQANNIMEYARAQKNSDSGSALWMLAHSIITGLILKSGDDEED